MEYGCYKIESKITTKTRAIMVVHIYGLPVEMDKVIEIANRYNLLLIEDAAEFAKNIKVNHVVVSATLVPSAFIPISTSQQVKEE